MVLPCLNEAGGVGVVVRDALAAMSAAGYTGEVVVADNGSTDGSPDEATAAGARVVHEKRRGYGNAYHAGIGAARGRVIVMADADGTYPMDAIASIVAPVLAGDADLVIASRMSGDIGKDAMPWSHRYIGTPVLTGVLNRLFGIRVSDAHSGMRAIGRDAYDSLRLGSAGMEYASEMIVQAARHRLRVREVPIDYRPRVGESKLRTWPDGWRHLKFLLLASPTWLFLVPGVVAFLLGSIVVIPLTFGEVHIGKFQLILHPMLPGAVLMIIGFQLMQTGVLLRAFLPDPSRSDRLTAGIHRVGMERWLLIGIAMFAVGVVVGIVIAVHWATTGFGPLNEIRQGIAAMVLTVIGAQTVFGAFLFAFFLPEGFGNTSRLGQGPPDVVT